MASPTSRTGFYCGPALSFALRHALLLHADAIPNITRLEGCSQIGNTVNNCSRTGGDLLTIIGTVRCRSLALCVSSEILSEILLADFHGFCFWLCLFAVLGWSCLRVPVHVLISSFHFTRRTWAPPALASSSEWSAARRSVHPC
jgi:hypothetical protein